jgi:hypothetical protein
MPYKIADVDILIVPGLTVPGPDHWQSRWARNLKTACWVGQAGRARPGFGELVGGIVKAVELADRPALLVAHSSGVLAVVHAVPRLDAGRIAGAFLVAPIDPAPAETGPSDPLPFPSLLVASRNDPFAAFERSQGMALDWGSDFADAGHCGHIDSASGHGPWPEGLLKLGQFLKRLG